MSKIAIYAGSFDPITLGHVDIIKRACKVFDKVIVGVLINSNKTPTFSIDEKIDMIQHEMENNGLTNTEVVAYNGMLVNMCHEYGAQTIIRGLRAVTDFEAELQLAQVNKAQAPDVDTMFFVTNLEFTYVSSSVAREIAYYKGDMSKLVSSYVAEKLSSKYKH